MFGSKLLWGGELARDREVSGGGGGGRGKAGFRFKSHMMAFSSGWLDQSVMHGRNMIRDEASCSFSMSIAAITRAL